MSDSCDDGNTPPTSTPLNSISIEATVFPHPVSTSKDTNSTMGLSIIGGSMEGRQIINKPVMDEES